MRYTLLIIDMQTAFPSAYNALNGVLRAIKKAKKNRSPIVILEYSGSGNTLLSIAKAIRGYEPVYFETKDIDNGSFEVLDCLERHNLSHKIRACGVNLDCCVRDTLEGLVEDCDITLLTDATATDSGDRGNELTGYYRWPLKFGRKNRVLLRAA